jgi:hypothetical protein
MSNETNHQDGEHHALMVLTVFDKKGKPQNTYECCACQLKDLDVSHFKKGTYITAIEVNESLIH